MMMMTSLMSIARMVMVMMMVVVRSESILSSLYHSSRDKHTRVLELLDSYSRRGMDVMSVISASYSPSQLVIVSYVLSMMKRHGRMMVEVEVRSVCHQSHRPSIHSWLTSWECHVAH